MARFIRSIIGYNDPIAVPWRVAASQTITAGDLVELDATSRYLKSAIAASTTLAGVAQSSITTGATVTVADTISVLPLTEVVVRLDVDQSGAKKTFADTDLALTKYALKTPTSIDPNVTAGGMCQVVDYDNTKKTVDVVFAAAAIAPIA